jgi:LysM repeat protein
MKLAQQLLDPPLTWCYDGEVALRTRSIGGREMRHVSRLFMLLACLLMLVLVACQREQADPFAEDAAPVGETPIGEPAPTDAEVAPLGEAPAPGVEEPAPVDPAAEPVAEPAPADAEPAGVEPAAPAPEATTVAIEGAQPEAAPEPEVEAAAVEAPAEPAPEAAPEAPAMITHTVQSGDTLYGIATRYGTTVEQLRAVNGLTTNFLAVGQVLQIPTGQAEAAPAPAPEAPAAAPAPTGPVVHVVQRGEWLWRIARQYNTTPDAIKRANNLVGDTIYAGQQLVIPNQ